MQFIAAGMIKEPSTEVILHISHCGRVFELTGLPAKLWLGARGAFRTVNNPQEEKAVSRLQRMGLAETAEDSPQGRYRALTQRSVACTAEHPELMTLTKDEAFLLKWLSEAGIHLTTAELVYLLDRKIEPLPELTGTENRQALIERIYTKENIFDNILENMMEDSPCRDRAVRALLGLLKKNRIVLI